jgi:uncharacterized protein YggE
MPLLATQSLLDLIRREFSDILEAEKDVVTKEFEVTPSDGFTISRTIDVRISNLTVLADFVDSVGDIGEGITVGGINFQLGGVLERYVRFRSLQLAVSKAHDRAEVMAAVAGAKLGALKTLATFSIPWPDPYPQNVFVADAIRSKNSPSPLAVGLFTYSVKAVVKFDLVFE